MSSPLATLQQYGTLILIAFVLFVLYRFRDFVFGTVVGGIVERVFRSSRMAQARAKVERDSLDRISEDFRTLSDTLLEHSVRGGKGEARYPWAEKIATVRQMVGRLGHDAPTLQPFLNPISIHFDQGNFIRPEEARHLLDPVSREVQRLVDAKK